MENPNNLFFSHIWSPTKFDASFNFLWNNILGYDKLFLHKQQKEWYCINCMTLSCHEWNNLDIKSKAIQVKLEAPMKTFDKTNDLNFQDVLKWVEECKEAGDINHIKSNLRKFSCHQLLHYLYRENPILGRQHIFFVG